MVKILVDNGGGFAQKRLCTSRGAVAQLGERLNGIQEVVSSILISSTNPASDVSFPWMPRRSRRKAASAFGELLQRFWTPAFVLGNCISIFLDVFSGECATKQENHPPGMGNGFPQATLP